MIVAYGGLGIMGASAFAIARVSARDRWRVRGVVGLVAGLATFLLSLWLGSILGWSDPSPALLIPAFGTGAATALPGGRPLIAARVIAVLALSLVPAMLHDSGAFVRWVVHAYPDGSSMEGWEDGGRYLVPLSIAGVGLGLFLPMALRRRGRSNHLR
jgi:hypothetical protein